MSTADPNDFSGLALSTMSLRDSSGGAAGGSVVKDPDVR